MGLKKSGGILVQLLQRLQQKLIKSHGGTNRIRYSMLARIALKIGMTYHSAKCRYHNV